MIYLSCAVSDVQLTIFVRVSEFTSDNVVAVELAQLEILIYESNRIFTASPEAVTNSCFGA
ncbi:MAG: hypothetical protein K2K57_14130 [Oscillospiraceae bacterium]|nr:hypothetical protein [Oscillospiraceae bacterium]